MQEENWLYELTEKNQLAKISSTNEYTQKFGLLLSEEEIHMLMEERKAVLKKEGRVEFGEGILPKLIYAFCDSSYISSDNYADTLNRLQELFYMYKNEMQDEITDDELIAFMKEQFDTICFGDLDYLGETCLDIFAQAIRAGYQGYIESEGKGEFGQFDIVARWDRGLYLAALDELIGD